MIAIAIDDEQLMLYALLKAVKASDDIEDVVGFSNCDEALDWLEINTPDVALQTCISELSLSGLRKDKDYIIFAAPRNELSENILL